MDRRPLGFKPVRTVCKTLVDTKGEGGGVILGNTHPPICFWEFKHLKRGDDFSFFFFFRVLWISICLAFTATFRFYTSILDIPNSDLVLDFFSPALSTYDQ
jgi:hypothetical protein